MRTTIQTNRLLAQLYALAVPCQVEVMGRVTRQGVNDETRRWEELVFEYGKSPDSQNPDVRREIC